MRLRRGFIAPMVLFQRFMRLRRGFKVSSHLWCGFKVFMHLRCCFKVSVALKARPLNSSNAAPQLPITNYQLPIWNATLLLNATLPNAALALPHHFTAVYPASMAAILALTTFSPLRSKIRLTPAITLSYSMPNIGIAAPNKTILAA